MAAARYYCFLCFLILFCYKTLDAEEIFQVSLNGDYLGSNFELLGNAKMAKEGNFVNLVSNSEVRNSGQLVCKKPIRLIDGKSREPVSVSIDFTFSMAAKGAGGDGEGLAVVFFPAGGGLSEFFGSGKFGISKGIEEKNDGRFVAVEYDTRKDADSGNGNGNRVGVSAGSLVSTEVIDVSSVGVMLNGGDRLQSWIDYEASSKRLEIRLSKLGVERPDTSLLSFPINFWQMWGDREVLVGISSSSGNSTQVTIIYSWSLRVRTAPSWLHSQPLDPRVHVDEVRVIHKKKNCVLSILGRVIFITGCGTLVAFFLLLLWVVFFLRNSAVPPEFPMKNMEFGYEKIDVNNDAVVDVPTS